MLPRAASPAEWGQVLLVALFLKLPFAVVNEFSFINHNYLGSPAISMKHLGVRIAQISGVEGTRRVVERGGGAKMRTSRQGKERWRWEVTGVSSILVIRLTGLVNGLLPKSFQSMGLKTPQEKENLLIIKLHNSSVQKPMNENPMIKIKSWASH